MPLEQLANIAEIFGMLVISITLIFLIAQMRQNTKALHSSTAYSKTLFPRKTIESGANLVHENAVFINGERERWTRHSGQAGPR